jgi:hypothetical protein
MTSYLKIYFVVNGLKIIDHGNLDNNLESLCINVVYSYEIVRHVQPLGVAMLEIPYVRQLI